ncbi:Oidioi.mRNA.OKI2018_I69.chr2.g4670.t2.cds [Oikopleura dioica]|uniref:alkaline phosphatase n=1 Tax=Oikopleura dioica TaxID=34765 RepID=A0ABN7SY24_OIKDI|nr:Oidioi.mRNA.OKI2018_I69.chr2.g4670.t2.cds [Oikopleura dioica]
MKLSSLFLGLSAIVEAHDEEYHPSIRKKGEKIEVTWPVEEEKEGYWRDVGKERLRKMQQKPEIKGKAKNAILFIGDGMGVPSVTAGRILAGGEGHVSSMESLDYTGLVKTYNVDYQTPDSAGTATAYLTGVKGNYGTVGITAAGRRGDCQSQLGNEVQSVLEKAKAAGKSVGFVTTTYVNHASPSGVFGKSAERTWYSDKRMKQDPNVSDKDMEDCKDLALQLFEHDDIDVIMGGGREFFVDRLDGRNLIQEWKDDGNVTLVETESELRKAMDNLTLEQRLIGIYADRHLEYEYVREKFAPEEPQLRLMAEAAIKKLSLNPNGFYLFVEGGKIDLAHHDTMPVNDGSLYDWKEFDTMIGNSLEMVNLNETIVMVSADHSHTFSIGAYGKRGENIFGPGSQTSPDGENVMILGYANGPGYNIHEKTDQSGKVTCVRKLPSEYQDEWDTSNGKKPFENLLAPTAVRNINPSGTNGETHGAEDVAVYAQGPWAHLMTGTHEQVMVAHVMEFALCIGDYAEEEHCKSSAELISLSFSLLFAFFFLQFE